MPPNRVTRKRNRLLTDVPNLAGYVFLVEAMPLPRLSRTQHEEPPEPQILHIRQPRPLAPRAHELRHAKLIPLNHARIDHARVLLRRDLPHDIAVVSMANVAARKLLDEPRHGCGFTPIVHNCHLQLPVHLSAPTKRTSVERLHWRAPCR